MGTRIRAAVEKSFLQLLREKSYNAITIGDLVERAEVSRSTFYRYYTSKADVMVGLHERIFTEANFLPDSQAGWLADAPPPGLIHFVARFGDYGRFQTPLSMFGSDVDTINLRISQVLARHIEAVLRQHFDTLLVPMPILSYALAGAYTWVFRWYVNERAPMTPEVVAAHLHHLVRAMLLEAFKPG